MALNVHIVNTKVAVTDLIHIFFDNNFFNLKLFMGDAVTMEH